MRVLVTGARGQLGQDCVAAFGDGDVIAAGRNVVDLSDPPAARAAVIELRPDVVVNCAAYTAVDKAESEPELAATVNEAGARAIAQACGAIGARLIHISTDYVYDGTKPSAYVETDQTNPLSVYGRTKLAGDVGVIEEVGLDGCVIMRTSWVCGQHGNNMIKTVLNLMAADPTRQLKFVDDQIGHPSITSGLASMIRTLAHHELGGIFHVTHQGAVSWYEFVAEILAMGGYSRDQVQPISSAELSPPRPAVRPMNSVLDNAALRASGIALLPDFRDVLPDVISAIRAAR